MASRTFFPVQALDKEVKHLYGKVVIGSSGAIESQNSLGFTVTHPGTGVYLVTLSDKYPELLWADCTIMDPSGADLKFEISAYDMSAKTVTFRFSVSGSTPTATDPASDNELFFHVVLKNSKVLP